jgi:4-amino-4-deoxy-L-arabinose transferase-like glycosyltransferase
MSAPRQLHLMVACLLALTAIVLFAMVPALSNLAGFHYTMGFVDDYDLIAHSLANGQGYRLAPNLDETMIREPAYPLLLAGAFKIFGYSLEAARLVNLLLAGITALLLWHLAFRVTREAAVGLVAAAIFLLHPGILIVQARGGVEGLFMLGMVAFMLLLYRALEADQGRQFFVAGLVLGAAVLVRSTPLLFPLALLPLLILAAPQGARRRRLAQWAFLVAGMALAMSPWVARNYALSGHFIPTATVLGVAAQEGQYTCERLSFGRGFLPLQLEAAEQRNQLASELGLRHRAPLRLGTAEHRYKLAPELGLRFKNSFYQHFYRVRDEHRFNRTLLEGAVLKYRENPALLARCVGQNLVYFWILGKNGLSTALNLVLQLPLMALALAGLFVLRRRAMSASWTPVALLVAYVVAVHLPVMVHARHSIPLVPFLAIFAGVALVAAWRRRASARPVFA